MGPDPAVDQELAVILVYIIVDLLILRPLWREHEKKLLSQLRVEHVRIKLGHWLLSADTVLVCFEDLNELVGVVDLVLEQKE